MIRLSHQTIELNPIHPFVIARGGYAHHRNVIIRLTDDDGLEGFGEAAPNRYYGESVSTVIAALGQFKPVLERADPFDLETTEANLNRVLRGNASAKSAVSAALHDMVGKKLGLPVYRLWGLDASTTCTSRLASATSSSVARKAATSVVGRRCTNPTVSVSNISCPPSSRTRLVIGSSVAKRLSSTKLLARESRFSSVDLPAFV